jgi:hypothetical protein
MQQRSYIPIKTYIVLVVLLTSLCVQGNTRMHVVGFKPTPSYLQNI